MRAAIVTNAPRCIVLNHVDYVGTPSAEFVEGVESSIGQSLDWLGTPPRELVPRHAGNARRERRRDL